MAREYKDSGIEWIGRIPKEWSCAAMLRSLKGRITDGPHETPTLQDKGIPFISVDSLNDSDTVDLSVVKKFISQELYDEYKKKANIERGDILFSKAATIGKTAIVKDELFMVWSPLAIIKPSPLMSIGKYMYYVLNCEGLIRHICLLGTYNTQINVGMRALEKAMIPVPSIDEQQRIADYLDEKCREIDSLISLQEQMIAQLTDYKESVITEAVTKGLDPNAHLVPSGIDWIGDYPQHWVVKKIGYIFDNLDYLREPISAELRERNNPIYDYYGASGVIDKIDYYNVDDKVLLIGEDGANLVMRNLPLVYKAEGKFWVNNHAHILKPKHDDYDYMAHTLEAANYRNYITGSAQPKLSQENLQAVKLPVPPISEQRRIATYLDNKCAEIDALIALKQQKIETLKNYKKSLIYECVTGKIEI